MELAKRDAPWRSYGRTEHALGTAAQSISMGILEMAAFSIQVPDPTGDKTISVEAGSSLIFVGANGRGNTRLAVRIETDPGPESPRISAHLALSLNPSVQKISEGQARYGWHWVAQETTIPALAIAGATNRGTVHGLGDHAALAKVGPALGIWSNRSPNPAPNVPL